ncbi:hypothetical protein BDF14DRAFT_1730863 [Spinellus fusiger]|nr:hypothetical protein BDF14DRAFT_1732460 [Spinellus fusiger]KAI7865160.1 hypothetical protein BDF14DRAFT_1730863 [Spinellus fusiger]
MPHALALWILTRFGPRFGLYYALLAIPECCDDHLIRCLTSNGADIPRHLVQSFVKEYGHPMPIREAKKGRDLIPYVDSLFNTAVQSIPFSGYATLMYLASTTYGDISMHNKQGDLRQFLTILNETKGVPTEELHSLVNTYGFMPGPILFQTGALVSPSLLHFIKMAHTSPKDYANLSFLFEFDPAARRHLWDAIHRLLFEFAYLSELNEDHYAQLRSLSCVILPKTSRHMLRRIKDQDIFIYTYTAFFTRHSVGYATQRQIQNYLTLLFTYIKPGFCLATVLKSIASTTIEQTNISDAIIQFLNKRHMYRP